MARILIIDDEDQIRKMLRQMLERAGYEVDDAPNGKEGIQRFRQQPADLIITDIIMQEKDGIETIMELRREYPDVKIIAVSGGGTRLTCDSCLRAAEVAGADRSFTKPVNVSGLLDAVSELLAFS